MTIQWYPGHMAKTKRLIKDVLKFVDVVVEVLDARIPMSSRNPDVDGLVGDKPRIVVLNKCDISNDDANKRWTRYFETKGCKVILLDSLKGKNVNKINDAAKEIAKEKLERLAEKGRVSKPIRLMIIGIPNVGKSTIINKLAGRSIAKTGDKPGVTKSNQWIKAGNNVEIMDTPGILWPKFQDERVGRKLAFVNAIKEEILDVEELAYMLINELKNICPKLLAERYNIDMQELNGDETDIIVEKIARKRGCIMSGGRINTERVSNLILDDFRSIKIGKITLEFPEEFENGN